MQNLEKPIVQDKKISHTKKIIICGIFLAVALVLNRFRIVVPYGGAPIIKISLCSPFYKFIAIIFGPFYGGLIPALGDFIDATTNPIGNYIWMLTVTAFLKGFCVGYSYLFVKKLKIKNEIISLLITIAPAGIVFSFVNSFILRLYLYIPAKLFWSAALVRVAEELIMIIYNIAMLMIMMTIYETVICREQK